MRKAIPWCLSWHLTSLAADRGCALIARYRPYPHRARSSLLGADSTPRTPNYIRYRAYWLAFEACDGARELKVHEPEDTMGFYKPSNMHFIEVILTHLGLWLCFTLPKPEIKARRDKPGGSVSCSIMLQRCQLRRTWPRCQHRNGLGQVGKGSDLRNYQGVEGEEVVEAWVEMISF